MTPEQLKARMCPIGMDSNPMVCSAGSCDVCVRDRMAGYLERAEKAEAELAQLRLALAAQTAETERLIELMQPRLPPSDRC